MHVDVAYKAELYSSRRIRGLRNLKPTVLVVTTSRWFPTARLTISLARVGFTVKAVCPTHHPLNRTGAVEQVYNYYGLSPVPSITAAIHAAKPDVIVPGDDLATYHLHEIYRLNRNSGHNQAICDLIERSLGCAESFDVVYARTKLIGIARAEGVRAPKTEIVPDFESLSETIARVGFPMVLKADGSSGGEGVRIVRNTQEAESAYRALDKPPYWLRAAKRAIFDRDTTLIWPTLQRRRPVMNAQSLIAGSEATSTISCWKGKLLAALHFDVIKTTKSRGPATVIRLSDDPDMVTAAEKLVRRLNLSGMHGFDYMRETSTGDAYLIEMNPRTTQVGHLALGEGRDLCAALYAAVTGETPRPAPIVTQKDTIALFPHEWMRDPESSFLKSAYHDVPWESPGLVEACVSKHRRQRARLAPKTSFAESRDRVAGEQSYCSEGQAVSD